jgi:hypothetical protein
MAEGRIGIKLTRYMNGKQMLDSVPFRQATTPSAGPGAPRSTSARTVICGHKEPLPPGDSPVPLWQPWKAEPGRGGRRRQFDGPGGFGETQEFWKGLIRKEQTDPEAYRAAVRKHTDSRQAAADEASRHRGWGCSRPELKPEHTEEHRWAAQPMLDYQVAGGRKPARVLKSDMDFPTNRTTEFSAGDGSIRFDKATNTVHWDTDKCRNVIERARTSAAGSAFFNRLKKVRWTRGTGGVFHGDNEISHEETDRGEYVTTAYGPLGAAQEPSHCEEYTDSKGHPVTVPSSPTSSRNSGRPSAR